MKKRGLFTRTRLYTGQKHATRTLKTQCIRRNGDINRQFARRQIKTKLTIIVFHAALHPIALHKTPPVYTLTLQ